MSDRVLRNRPVRPPQDFISYEFPQRQGSRNTDAQRRIQRENQHGQRLANRNLENADNPFHNY